jgi:hypothetical protein
MVTSKRLDEIEATLANISNQISSLPSPEEVEAVRVELFDALNDLIAESDSIKNIMELLEQRINQYVS